MINNVVSFMNEFHKRTSRTKAENLYLRYFFDEWIKMTRREYICAIVIWSMEWISRCDERNKNMNERFFFQMFFTEFVFHRTERNRSRYKLRDKEFYRI